MSHRRDEEDERLAAAGLTIAELLIDVAAAERMAELASPSQRERAMDDLRQAVRAREQVCVGTLLDLYRFGREDYADEDLPLTDGRWSEDPFDPDTLRYHGIRTTGHAGIGAGAGAVVDVATGGLTLGTGTLVGAALGTGVGLARGFGVRIGDRLRGRERLMVDDATLRLLASRQLKLLAGLRQRGHAARLPLPAAARERWAVERLPAPLRSARRHSSWSTLNPGSMPDAAGAPQAASRLARALIEDLERESAEVPGASAAADD